MDMPMFRVFLIDRAQLEFRTVRGQRGADPTARTTRNKHICRGRQIDEMNSALMPRQMPVVGMAENSEFDLAARGDHGQECASIAQSPFDDWIKFRVVMHHD